MKKSIAVIGQGFVGGSLTTVFSERGFTVFTYDKAGKHKTAPGGIPLGNVYNNSLESSTGFQPKESVSLLVSLLEKDEDLNFSKVYFVCLPTPMYEDGSADLSIVEGVLQELADAPGERIAVVKSTVPPGSTENWNKKFSSQGLHVIFNPEFLTEANALDDMRNQNRIILGGPRPWINEVKQIFQAAFPQVPIVKTSSTTAEMVKYMTNNFLTVKVAFANEMAQICEALDNSGLNVDYDKVVEYAKYDKRLGESHWSVPGPDGHLGFGGHCFVKDLNAMIKVADDLNVDTPVMDGSWVKNLEVRPERDWENLIGRAVSIKKG
jgi:nucleotide sugar dehydrogenase